MSSLLHGLSHLLDHVVPILPTAATSIDCVKKAIDEELNRQKLLK